mgnify:CR=1 FL=1
MEFKEFKKEILSRAEKSNACDNELNKAKNAQNFKELIKVITDNFYYSCNYKIIDVKLLEKVGRDICNDSNLYFNCDCGNGYLLAENCNVEIINSTATLWGNSIATLLENSTSTLLENSTATLRGNSTATLWENSKATLWENSTAELRGNSKAELFGNSKATLRGNSKATLWENSKAKILENSKDKIKENSKEDI